MRSLFHSHDPEPAPTVEPVPTVFPKIEGADIAADFLGKRVAGDFYDSLRVSPERVLFGLLDVAGRREDNRGILDGRAGNLSQPSERALSRTPTSTNPRP